MKPELEDRVRKHGEDLIKVFGLPDGTDPVLLCKRLRRLENKATVLTTLACNGDIAWDDNDYENDLDEILGKVNTLLNNTDIPVFINRDPRGYALKIKEKWMHANPDVRLHRDWGNFGILAPDLRDN